MHPDSDAELLARWCAGDREAYAVLVARHYGLVQTACRRQAVPGEEDDCTQAVFLILARKPAAAGRAPALAAWLLRVAWYVCRNAHRVAQRRRLAEGAAVAVETSQAPRPEALDHLDGCLLKLPERQRAAVCLHYLSGKTAEEVAAHLGTNRDNAYLLISRGLAGLRVLLARRGVAVASAGLTGLLAAEAHAAASPAPTAVLTNLLATPSAGVATIASGAMTAMTIATITPFAVAAGLVLAAGTLSLALTAEASPPPATPPPPAPVQAAAPVPPPAAAPTQVVVPLSVFSIKDGQTIHVAGHEVVADPKGLTLPIGVPVELVYRAQASSEDIMAIVTGSGGPKDEHLTVTCVDANSGPMVPAWALDDPLVQTDGRVTAVGKDSAGVITGIREMAFQQALVQAVRSLPGLVEIKDKDTAEAKLWLADGRSKSNEVSYVSVGPKDEITVWVRDQDGDSITSRYAQVSGRITDCILTINPVAVPAETTTTKPGVVDRHRQVAQCWVRISATVHAVVPPIETDKRKLSPAESARNVSEIGKWFERQVSKFKASQP